MRSVRLLAAALAAGSLALSACGGDATGEVSPAVDKGAAAIAGDPDTWPLTGLAVNGSDTSVQRRPVLVVKMDNTGSSAPQKGLGSADLVVEELVEGGMTRLAAFYYSDIPGEVGPVRSMRASDIGIVAPADGSMVTSGAAAVTIVRIRKAGIDYFAEDAAGFFRDASRSAPYNLFTNLEDVAKSADQGKGRPADYLPWGEESDLPKGQPAGRIAATFSGSHTTNWSFQDGGYVNEKSYAADGDEFPADTVLVLRVGVGDAGYRDPAGNAVPETRLEGEGEAMMFHAGQVVRGTWSKDGLDSAIELKTKAGGLTVPAGRVWVELVPTGSGDVTFSP
ncbi:MAG: DUF3048 domain-containing protein [Actinomycetota bacterium]|nr:DUF3048 domain-containing protein [Actinomycetota bacterium]